ncbi:MAG: hypothetical protein ACOC83_01820 [Gemmatimonadota bacterium]
MHERELEHRLHRSGRFGEAADVEVSAVRVNDFGEGEYEARFRYAGSDPAAEDDAYLADLKRRVEDVLPRAWVAAFSVSPGRNGSGEVAVTFDYLPEGSLTLS